MGTFHKDLLPDPQAYYESQGLVFQKGGRHWRTTRCEFHGGSDSMRIHLPSGAFICMACCGARGGDVLAYQMAAHGQGFVEAARALGAWREDDPPSAPGKPARRPPTRPKQPSPRAVMSLVNSELTLCAILVSDLLHGKKMSEEDAARFREAAGRIQFAATFAGIEEESHDW